MKYQNSNSIIKDPIILILTALRERAFEIYEEWCKFEPISSAKKVCMTDDLPHFLRQRKLKGSQVIITTPLYLQSLVTLKELNLESIKYLVFDSADEIFEKTTLKQIKNSLKGINKSAQTLAFSISYSDRFQKVAQKIIKDPVLLNFTDSVKEDKTENETQDNSEEKSHD